MSKSTTKPKPAPAKAAEGPRQDQGQSAPAKETKAAPVVVAARKGQSQA